MRPTVLVADDDPSVLALLTDVLELEDCNIVAVRDGTLALEALDIHTPDLVILDVMMPGRNGLEVLRNLRARPDMKMTPVLIVSAKRDDESVWEGMQEGCDYYITKPFDPSELVHHVRGLLERHAF